MNYSYFYPGARRPLDAEAKRLAKNREAREARARAKEAKIRRAFNDKCYAVIEGILALGDDPAVYLPAIPKLFLAAGAPGNERYEVFLALDEKPRSYSYDREYWEWHGKLRSVRNHPIHGRELFAAINGKEIS